MLRRLLVAVVLASLVIGCGIEASGEHRVVLPGNPEVFIEPLPVTLADSSDVVTGIVAAHASGDGLGRIRATKRADGVLVEWIGGACDKSVSIGVARAGDGYAIRIRTDRGFIFLGCTAAGVGRAVFIQMSVSPERSLVTAVLAG